MNPWEAFLQTLDSEIQIFNRLQEILKQNRLTPWIYHQSSALIASLKDSNLRHPLQQYLDEEYQFASSQPFRTLLSSDILESLFGKFKQLIPSHGFSELNRSVLLVPLLGHSMTPEFVQQAFDHTQHKEVLQWIEQEIGPTLLSKRRKALGKGASDKPDNVIPFPTLEERLKQDTPFGQKTVGTKLALG